MTWKDDLRREEHWIHLHRLRLIMNCNDFTLETITLSSSGGSFSVAL